MQHLVFGLPPFPPSASFLGDSPANQCITRRIAEGKTKPEAIRAATRHLATKTWRILHNQQLQ
ncbi:MAG: hypothetical protein GY720_18925 [bacterium]|nr:hypothetical protein [bacterium]